MSLLLALLGPTSSQTVGAPLLASTNYFPEQILQLEPVGSLWLYPTTIVSSTALYTPTVEAVVVTQTLDVGLYSNTISYYSPTISTGGVTLEDPLYTNTNSFFAATITVGAVTLTPSLYTNTTTLLPQWISIPTSSTKKLIKVTPKPQHTQPQTNTVIDGGNPLARGLVDFWVPSSRSKYVNSPPQKAGKQGKYHTFNGSNQYIDHPLKRYLNIVDSGASIVSVFYTGNNALTYQGVVSLLTDEGTASSDFFGIMIWSGKVIAISRRAGDSTYNIQRSTLTLQNNTVYTCVIVLPPTPVGQTNNIPMFGYKVYIDGIDVTSGVSAYSAGYPGLYDGPIKTLRLGTDIIGDPVWGAASYLNGGIYYAGVYNRALNPKEITNLSSNPYQVLKPANQPIYLTSLGTVTSVTLTPTLYTNTNTYYNSTITTGGVTLLDPLYSNTSTLYNATVTTGLVTVAPALYSNSSVYYNPLITTGGVTLLDPLYTNTSTLYNATVTTGIVSLTVPLYTNTSTLFTPSITKRVFTRKQSARKTQPQLPTKVNYSNPLAKGLVGVWQPSTLSTNTNNPTQVVGSAGKGINFTKASSQRLSVPLTKPVLIQNTGATIITIGYTTAATGVIGTYASINDGSAYFASLLRGDLSRGVCAAYYDGVDGNSFTEWFSSPQPDKKLCVSVITADTALNMRVYLNGVDVTVGNQNFGFYGASPLTKLSVGHVGNAGTSEYLDGSVFLALAYDRRLTPTEVAEISANPWGIFKAANAPVYLSSIYPATLSVPLYSNTNSFFAAAITTGAITLASNLYSNTNVLYNPVINLGANTLTPSLYNNSSTYYSPAVTVGNVTLLDPLYTNTNTLYTPTITRGVVTLTPVLYTNSTTFYTPTITVASFTVTLNPPLLSSTYTLYNPSVLKAAVITETWIGSGNVSNKTPTTGGGTWQVITTQAQVQYGGGFGSGRAGIYDTAGEPTTGTEGVFRHSTPLVNGTISTIPSIDIDYQPPVYLWARSVPGPNAEITHGYYLRVSFFGVDLYKRVAGVDTQLGGAGVEASGSTLSLSVSGSTILVKLNNSGLLEVTDTSITAAGYFGCGVTATYGSDSWIFSTVGPINIQPAIASTISPALYSNTNVYYNSTITTGGVTLLDPLYTNTSSFFTPSITIGIVTLTPSLYSNSNTLYNPTITVSAITLTSSLYSNSNTLYNPTITRGAVTLAPGLYSNSNTLYNPTITVSAVTLTPGLYTNSNILYPPVSTLLQLLTAPLLTNTNSYYNPTATVGVAIVDLTLYSNTNTVYSPTIAVGAVTVTTPLLTNTSTVLVPTVVPGTITLAPPVLASSNVYYLPTITKGPVIVSPAVFTNSTNYYTPSIVPGAVNVQLPTIASNSVTYAPAVYGTAAGITPGNIVVDVPSANIASYTESTNWVPNLVINNVVRFVEVPHYIVNVNSEHAIQYSDSLDYILDKPSGSVSS